MARNPIEYELRNGHPALQCDAPCADRGEQWLVIFQSTMPDGHTRCDFAHDHKPASMTREEVAAWARQECVAYSMLGFKLNVASSAGRALPLPSVPALFPEIDYSDAMPECDAPCADRGEQWQVIFMVRDKHGSRFARMHADTAYCDYCREQQSASMTREQVASWARGKCATYNLHAFRIEAF